MTKELLGSLELNRIYQRDCIDGMRLLPDKSIDMILCDLPYGTTKCKWDTIIPFDELWTQYERVIKDNGAIVLTASQPFTSLLISSNIKRFKYCWVWDKKFAGNYLLAKYQPLKTHEDVCVFSKGTIKYNPQMIKRDKPIKKGANTKLPETSGSFKPNPEHNNRIYKYKFPISILSYSVRDSGGKRVHPTQKPVALFEYLIKTYTNEGEIVLDNCMGSGTTAVAALRLNRKFIGFEIESEYVRIANQRLEAVLDKEAERKLTE